MYRVMLSAVKSLNCGFTLTYKMMNSWVFYACLYVSCCIVFIWDGYTELPLHCITLCLLLLKFYLAVKSTFICYWWPQWSTLVEDWQFSSRAAYSTYDCRIFFKSCIQYLWLQNWSICSYTLPLFLVKAFPPLPPT